MKKRQSAVFRGGFAFLGLFPVTAYPDVCSHPNFPPPPLWLGYYISITTRTRTDDNHKARSGSVIHVFHNLWRENNAPKAYTVLSKRKTLVGLALVFFYGKNVISSSGWLVVYLFSFLLLYPPGIFILY